MSEQDDIPVNVEAELDRFFQGPLSAFVAERNKLVKTLRAAGNRDAAEEIARLQRPSTVAWVVNQLHFRAPELLDGLKDAGARLRDTQESMTSSDEFATRKRAHREALRAAADRACALAEEQGITLTADSKRRIEMNLNLLSAAGETTRPPPGRMSVELEPLGFDALTATLPAIPPSPKTRAAPEEVERRRRMAATKDAFDAASLEVRRLTREAELSQAVYEQAAGDAEAAERRANDARRARDDAQRAADDARAHADAARGELEQARRALDALETEA